MSGEVEDGEGEGWRVVFGELVGDVGVEEVEEDGGGEAEGEAEEVVARAGWGAVAGWVGRGPGFFAEDAYLFDAFGGDELGEAGAGGRLLVFFLFFIFLFFLFWVWQSGTYLQTGCDLLSRVAS